MPVGNRGSRGFTYVGLLMFIALLGIASAATVSLGAAVQRRAQEEELLHIGRQFQQAFKRYYDATPAGRRPYPDSLQALTKDPRFREVRRYLRQVYADPLTGRESWGVVPAPGGGIAGVFSLSEAKPIKIGQFDLEFKAFEGKEKYSDWVFGYAPAPSPKDVGIKKQEEPKGR